MTRRASLPGVDELFRSSKDRAEEPAPVEEAVSLQIAKTVELPEDKETDLHIFEEPDVPVPAAPPASQAATPAAAPVAVSSAPETEEVTGRRPRHDEKVTFYCTASDLTRIERARLALRAEHRLASDRGRIVRAALAEILDDFERRGGESALVARLRSKGAPEEH